jgi:hypothetical protein
MPGIHTYSSYVQSSENDFDARTRARLDGVEGEESDVFDKNPNKFSSAVNNTAMSNADRQAAAITRADSFSFQIANPWFKQTDKNTNLVNRWLDAQGITNPTYPDFAAAADALMAVLDVDSSQKAPTSFKGAITGRTYDTLDGMIANERQASLRRVPERTAEEEAFDNLPIEEVQARIKHAVRGQMLEANGLQTEKNGSAWASLNPWYFDSTRNGELMLAQMRKNGVADGLATIEQYDAAAKQLRDAGLLQINKNAVAKQEAAEVAQLAADHQAEAFNLAEAEGLSMEELYRRGGGGQHRGR